jgi:fructokinase
MKQILCSGEILYDFLSATPGLGLAKSETFEKRPGGSPFNIAVGLSRLGCDTGFLVKLGTDEFGQELKELLLAERLDPRYILEGRGQNTTLAMAAIDAEGKPEFRFYRDNAADVSLTWNELPELDPAKFSLWHFGSISLIEPPASETYIRLFHRMKNSGVLTVLDPNIRPLFLKDRPGFRPRLLEWIAEVDVLKLSDDDLAWVTGVEGVEAGLEKLPFNREGLVVVTEGPRGACAVLRGGEPVKVPGFKVEVAETSGCGDAFMAGVMFRLSQLAETDRALPRESELPEMLRFACACAAIVATRRGAANSMPTLDEAEQFLSADGRACARELPR